MTQPTEAPGAPEGTGQPAPPEPTAPPVPQPPPSAPKNDQPRDVSSLPDWAQQLIKDTRAEAAKHRTDKQTAAQQAQAADQQRNAILKALGLDADGKKTVDPETLAKQVTDYKAKAWETTAENAILRVASGAGADADALLDSNSFLDTLDAFVEDDPNTAEFRTKLAKHVKDFVGKNPKFKATAGPARSGGEFPGGSGAGTPISEEQLKSMTPDQIAKAYGEGKLKHLM